MNNFYEYYFKQYAVKFNTTYEVFYDKDIDEQYNLSNDKLSKISLAQEMINFKLTNDIEACVFKINKNTFEHYSFIKLNNIFFIVIYFLL